MSLELEDLESRVISTIDSLACKNDSEHLLMNKQLAKLGGGGIMPNENKIQPQYYQGSAMADYVSNFDLNFDLGNVVKYVSRAGKKNGELAIEDLKKAQWYLNHALDCFQKEAEFNLKPPFDD